MEQIKLNRDTDFTPSQLRDWLSRHYTTKESGRPFTNADVYQYEKRGRLPDAYSGADITVLEDAAIGIKVLRLTLKK
jgi:hypothetical protein